MAGLALWRVAKIVSVATAAMGLANAIPARRASRVDHVSLLGQD